MKDSGGRNFSPENRIALFSLSVPGKGLGGLTALVLTAAYKLTPDRAQD